MPFSYVNVKCLQTVTKTAKYIFSDSYTYEHFRTILENMSRLAKVYLGRFVHRGGDKVRRVKNKVTLGIFK